MLLTLLNTSLVYAQINLVPNYSFEEYTDCPMGYPDLDGKCNHWTSFRGTPDYMNECSSVCGYHNNFGYQPAHTGQAYTGILLKATTLLNIREQIGVELLFHLEVGVRYYVSFYVSCGYEYLGTNVASNKIGARFTTYQYYDPNGNFTLPNNCSIYTNNIISDTLNWVQISGSLLPDSAYRYILIGGFFDDTHTNTLHLPYQVIPAQSYYYVDDVCVSTNALLCGVTPNANTSFTMPSAFSPNGDGMNDVYAPVPSSTIIEVFRIYNRWGQKIYEESGLNVGWNGNYKGEPQPTDVYGYYIEVKNGVTGEIEKRTGSFTLLR